MMPIDRHTNPTLWRFPVKFDLAMTDELLATTRAVRKRLDLDRPVPREIISQCLELAVQAPTGGNNQGWRWVIVDDAGKRKALADLYRESGASYLKAAALHAGAQGQKQTARVYDSASYLVDVLHRVPVHVIPCIEGRPPDGTPVALLAGYFGSILPAVWSFQLALRARGLGSVLTTLHLRREKEAAALLGIPDDVLQVALLPVAYTKGTDFKRVVRPPIANITHWNTW
jgi:nitroreductase